MIFSLFKNKEQPQQTISVVKPKLSIREQALTFFDKVYGLDDIKEQIYLTITAPKPVNVLLVSPPAGAKTLFASIIRGNCKDVLYFDGGNLSAAGVIETLYNNKNAKIIVIDEIDKLKKNEMSCFLGLLNDGQIDKTLKGKRISFKMDVRVIATSNSSVKLSKPILSRFMKINLPEYSDEEFVKVVQFCLKDDLPSGVSEVIANVLLANDRKDVRRAIGLAAWIRREHSPEDIERIITSFLKNDSEEMVDYN